MPTVLHINVAKNVGSTGRIAEQICLLAKSRGWVTYVAHGSSFSKTEQISVSSPTMDSYVLMRYTLINGDRETDPENHFEVVWEEYRPFSEGKQSVLVQLPSSMRHD